MVVGDERVNEQAGLMVMHTIWMRHHNRVEDRLHDLNPHWDGNKLYHETRKIIGALMQHIAFNEYLPLIVGPKFIAEFDLKLSDQYNGKYFIR